MTLAKPFVGLWDGLRRRSIRGAVALTGLLALAGCGGGGGSEETLTISPSYSGTGQLLRASTITATISGLNGHAPRCSLASGNMPQGMALGSDCTISGTPLQAGYFPIVIRLGAAGVSNQLDWSTAVTVLGPSVSYDLPFGARAGSSYSAQIRNISWTPTAADVLTYSVVEGNLPPGLAIDPPTGRLSGTPTTEGTYRFKIGVQVTNAGGTAAVVAEGTNVLIVEGPSLVYGFVQGYVGLPYSLRPTGLPGTGAYRLSAGPLPSGLALDPATGEISGIPLAAASGGGTQITLSNIGSGTSTAPVTVFAGFFIKLPLSIDWLPRAGSIGAPFSSRPVVQNLSPDPLTNIRYSYALSPETVLPTGLLLDGATGIISGTPTTGGQVRVVINVTVTLYGTTFMVPVEAWFYIS